MTAATGKSVLIIGASRGLGYALAAEYLSRGGR
jgi:NAD(P)-dependent dehydrogenase (short-subunit alcohol dehydrogenase family)